MTSPRRSSIRRSSIRKYRILNNSSAYSSLEDIDLDDFEESNTAGGSFLKIWGDISDFFHGLSKDKLKEYIVYFVDTLTINISFDHVVLAFTIFALFGRDIEILAGEKKFHDTFDGLYTACFTLFAFELLANSWAKTTFLSFFPFQINGYLFSFYWWLDLLSLVSLFPDVNWIAEGIEAKATVDAFGGANNNLSQAGRVLRLVRLVRLIRIYRIAYERRKRIKEERELMELVKLGIISNEELEKQKKLNTQRVSELGAHLSRNITQKVIIMILLMIIVLPLLTYSTLDRSSRFAITMLHNFNYDNSINNATKNAMIDIVLNFTSSKNIPRNYLLKLEMLPYVPGYVFDNSSRRKIIPNRYRYYLKKVYDSASSIIYTTEGLFTRHYFAMRDSLYNILLTICVAIVMICGAIIFTADAERLVLQPIERMMNVIEAVAKNPLAPISFSYSRGGSNHRSSVVSTTTEMASKASQKNDMKEGDFEMRLLETTIEKVTGLLRVGFGEAGAGIISANLSNFNRGTMIDPLLPGVRVYAIFGFCDIHRFEEATQKLGRDVLLFVNTIAEIVHSQVHSWGGQCNKNLGNAFVIVWRIGDEHTLIEANSASILSRAQQNTYAGRSSLSPSSSPVEQKSFYRLEMEDEDEVGTQVSDPTMYSHNQNRGQKHFNVDLKRVPGIDEIADKALIGYLKVIAEINRSPPVLNFRKDERLKTKTNVRNTLSSYSMPSNNHTNGSHWNLSTHGTQDSVLANLFERKSDASQGNDDHPFVTRESISNQQGNELENRPRSNTRRGFVRPRRGSFLYNQERSYYKTVISKTQGQSTDDFTVRMGFGLHAGWAIEGAVGSIYKVDATYLSPHVNTAARLETASKQYNVSLLCSHMFHELLSQGVQTKCRKIDRVTVKGSEVPLDIFTYDTMQTQIFQKVEDSAAFNIKSIKRLLSMTGARPSILKKSTNGALKRKSNASIESLPSDLTSSKRTSILDLFGYPKQEQQEKENLKDESLSPSGKSYAAMLFDNVTEEHAAENGLTVALEEEKKSELESASSPVDEATPRKSSVYFNDIYRKGSAFEGSPSPEGIVTHYPNLQSKQPPFNDERKLAEEGEEKYRDESNQIKSSISSNKEKEHIRSSVNSESSADPHLKSYYRSTVLSLLTKTFTAKQQAKGENIPPADPNIQHYYRSSVLSMLTKTVKAKHAEEPPTSPSPSAPESHVEPVENNLKKYYRSSVLSMITALKGKHNEDGDDSPNKKHHRGSTSSQESSSSSQGRRQINIKGSFVSVSSNHSLAAAPKLPLPAMGAHHNAQTRLLLSSVHKELIKSHSVYIKQLQHIQKYRDENEEYQEAMDHLNTLFPNAEIIVPPFFNTVELFNRDIDMLQLQVHVTKAFTDAFAQGLAEYLKGNWQRAKKFLLKSDSLMRESILAFQETPLYKSSPSQGSLGDGPSQTLLKYMEEHRFIVPKDWQGFRPLTSK